MALFPLLAGPTEAQVAAPAPMAVQGCLGCHGPAGRGAGTIPALAGRPSAEVGAALEAFRTGERPGTIMGRIVRGYSPAELADAAAYFAGQRP